MTQPVPPGSRAIDPQAEADRLAEARRDPPGRVWGVHHPYTSPQLVTVRVDGHPFPGRAAADEERRKLDGYCEWCESKAHSLVWRDTPIWNAE